MSANQPTNQQIMDAIKETDANLQTLLARSRMNTAVLMELAGLMSEKLAGDFDETFELLMEKWIQIFEEGQGEEAKLSQYLKPSRETSAALIKVFLKNYPSYQIRSLQGL